MLLRCPTRPHLKMSLYFLTSATLVFSGVMGQGSEYSVVSQSTGGKAMGMRIDILLSFGCEGGMGLGDMESRHSVGSQLPATREIRMGRSLYDGVPLGPSASNL